MNEYGCGVFEHCEVRLNSQRQPDYREEHGSIVKPTAQARHTNIESIGFRSCCHPAQVDFYIDSDLVTKLAVHWVFSLASVFAFWR